MNLPYRLLFLDLDGTIVGKTDVISSRTLTALHRAQEAGCTPVICTARNRYMVREIMAQIGGHGYAILANGAVLYDWATGQTLHTISLSTETVAEAVTLAHQFGVAPLCFGVQTEDGKLVYTDRRFAIWPRYLALNEERVVTCEDLSAQLPTLPISMGVYDLPKVVQLLAQAWRERLGKEVVVFDQVSHRYDCWTAYFNSAQANKAQAAQRVADMLGIPREQTLAIGDHINDIELLQWAGLGVCMGDGHEHARACAAHVTGTLEEDGAAEAIERFVLRSERRSHDCQG
jgi:Cof subfamily protein (haloacid dehalogenase superfamily)